MLRQITLREYLDEWEDNPQKLLSFIQALLLKANFDVDKSISYGSYIDEERKERRVVLEQCIDE